MTTIAKHLAFWLVVFVLISDLSVATERDANTDLITISARFVEVHSRTTHKAGDPDEQFIEDVITPSIRDIVERGGANITNAQRDALLNFFLASKKSASEEVSSIAASLYLAQKTKLCASISKLSQAKRAAALDRIKSGLAATGKPVPQAVCK
jgi:hypothetical protein